jgi:hypothetical protein
MYTDRNKYCKFVQFARLLEKSLIFTRKAKWTCTCAWLFVASQHFLLRQATDKLHSTGMAACLVSTMRCGAQIPDVMSVGRLKFRRAAPHICWSSEVTYTHMTLLAPKALSSQIWARLGPFTPSYRAHNSHWIQDRMRSTGGADMLDKTNSLPWWPHEANSKVIQPVV